MSLVQYTISNNSAVAKTFLYYSSSIEYNKVVPGFGSSTFIGDNTPQPTLVIGGNMVPEDTFLSDAYIPPSGSAWLWNNLDKVQYIKISNTPLTGSNISPIIDKAEWIEFSMVEAIDKNGNYIYPTAPNSARVERYIIDNSNSKGTYNSIIINSSSPETSTAVSADTLNAETGFSYIDQQFNVSQDCDPLLNNATEPRINEWLQDVDYSVNAITPVNFEQLINFTATKASVPQSNYTQLGFVNSRYEGSSTTRDNINEYNPDGASDSLNKLVYEAIDPFLINKGKGPSLGKIPNVELNNAYIAYFNRIIDPYPLLNNKVAYYTKYLIDESGNIFDPSVSNINFSIFGDTFQLKDYDNTPTRVNAAISSIEQGKELVKLTDGLHSVYNVGKYPVPILYTQTSSIGHVNEISLSGSRFFTSLGLGEDFLKLGIDIYATQSSAVPTTDRLTPATLPLSEVEWEPADITPFKSNNDPLATPRTNFPTSSAFPTYALLFPLDTESRAKPPNTRGGDLSDNYSVQGSFIFTTSALPGKYKGGDNENNLERSIEFYLRKDQSSILTSPFGDTNSWIIFDLIPYTKSPFLVDDIIGNYEIAGREFNVKAVKLVITTDPGGANEKIEDPLIIEEKVATHGVQWQKTSTTGLRLTPSSYYIEELIIQNIFKGNVNNRNARREALPLIAGGWATVDGEYYGYGSFPIKYDWIIEFEFNNIKQGTGLFLKSEGRMTINQTDAGRRSRPDDIFLFFGENSQRSRPPQLQWRRTFTPTFATGVNTKPVVKYSVTSGLSENAVINTAVGPFWRRYPIDPTTPSSLVFTDDELYMSSSILNQTYGKSFLQAKLPYNGSINTDFPLTVEPSFIEFDPITDIFLLEKGDEIRFENNEDFAYKIEEIIRDPRDNPNSALLKDKLRIRISPPFSTVDKTPTNFDFFVIRRYKDNKNFIILNQQMPYGVISTGKGEIAFSEEDGFVGVQPVSPSSSPGLLLPEYRISKFNTNPDLILKDLIEKDIVS